MWSPRASIRWALFASALVHLGGAAVLSEVEFTPRPAQLSLQGFEVAFEPTQSGNPTGSEERPAPAPPELVPGGLPLAGTLDRKSAQGRGGEQRAPEAGAQLFPFRSSMTLQDTELNNLAVNQVQRIHTGSERATLEERRASPHAADEVLLASGWGGHAERREPARRDAVMGAPARALPSAPSEAISSRGELPGDGHPTAPAQREQLAATLRPAQGIARGHGRAQTNAAKVAYARPNVDRGPAATPAEQVHPSVRDDLDAELLAAKLQRSFVDTSVQRARLVGPGTGGAAGDATALGETGHGQGAQARPYSPGRGTFNALDTSDARYLRWCTQQRARVLRELVFPRARALAKDQGTSLYRVELARDGGLSGGPHLVRSSGFADFDAAAARAIERATPFAPLPPELAPELDRISLLIPIAFANPMVE